MTEGLGIVNASQPCREHRRLLRAELRSAGRKRRGGNVSEAAASVLYSIDGAVVRVTIHRPEARNALSLEVMDGLPQAFARAAADPVWKGH